MKFTPYAAPSNAHGLQLRLRGTLQKHVAVKFDALVALLAMTADAASGNLPIGAVLCLPILFAAGMTLMDTTDGVLMVKTCNWAFVNPLRKIFYNLTTTSIAVAIALVIDSAMDGDDGWRRCSAAMAAARRSFAPAYFFAATHGLVSHSVWNLARSPWSAFR